LNKRWEFPDERRNILNKRFLKLMEFRGILNRKGNEIFFMQVSDVKLELFRYIDNLEKNKLFQIYHYLI